jgi:hypothetical protein
LAILNHGGEKHYLDNHNAFFWVNPSSGLMEPIINDQNGYGLSNHKNWVKNPIIKSEGAFVISWFKNPLNLKIYVEKLNELINTFGHEIAIEKLVRNQWGKIRSVLESEVSLSYSCSPARCFFPINKLDGEIEKLIKDIKTRIEFIRNELNRDQIKLIKKNANDFDVLVKGFSGITAQPKNNKPVTISSENIKKIGIKRRINLLPSISSKSQLVAIDIDDSFAFYNLSGSPEEYSFYNRLSNKEIKLENLEFNPAFRSMKIFSGLNYLNFKEKNIAPVILGPGKVVFNESKIFVQSQPVILKAGTNIHLGKGVQIIVQGPLTIEGTRNQPVIIKPIDPKKPFGVIALLGEKTKGSKINFLNMEGGSVGSYYNLNFSGMFSVHDCPSIEINNSFFGKNHIGDDVVHIMNSKVVINNSIFKDANLDALDFDLVKGKLINNQFINPGNDGLDLSMSNVTVDKNSFYGCKDKCISVGEGTEVKIKNSYIRICNIGIAVKDKSFATLKNSSIHSCKG